MIYLALYLYISGTITTSVFVIFDASESCDKFNSTAVLLIVTWPISFPIILVCAIVSELSKIWK